MLAAYKAGKCIGMASCRSWMMHENDCDMDEYFDAFALPLPQNPKHARHKSALDSISNSQLSQAEIQA